MFKGVKWLLISRAARVSEPVEGVLVLAEGLVLAGPQTGEKDLVRSGGDPVLLLAGLASISLVWSWVLEWLVNNHLFDVGTDAAVGDWAGSGLDFSRCFGGFVSEFVAWHI